MADKKKREAEMPLHTIRRGQIVATIDERQSNAGFTYLQFEITRRWLVKSSQSEKSGTGLFAHQEAEAIDAIKAACAYIRDRANGSEEPSNIGAEGAVSLPAHSAKETS